MVAEPVLLIPAFRYGKETPWAGEMLNRFYGKFAVGCKIGESVDFSDYSTLPDGRPISEVIRSLPFTLKWVDCAGQQQFHRHPECNEFLYVLHAYPDAKILFPEGNDAVIAQPLHKDCVLSVPANTIHALSGVLCISIMKNPASILRVNGLSDAPIVEYDHPCEGFFHAKHEIQPHNMRLIQCNDFDVYELTECKELPCMPRDHFYLITCLADGTIRSENKTLYLGKGQTVLIPSHCVDFRLTGSHFLLCASRIVSEI